MKRLLIMKVGKTHSGKSTFAQALEEKLENSIVMDQDNHAAFINTYYEKLQPKQGPNMLKYGVSKYIAEYAITQTNLHIIICNSNRNRKDREYLLKEFYPKEKFTQVIVHFDIPDDVLEERVSHSQRSTNIFRSASNFEQVLSRQQADSLTEEVVDPVEGEADHLFVIKKNEDVQGVIQSIVRLAQGGREYL
ncbi:AAA family ATPase [Ornithinibacillus halophilus]|uniref:AAA domain-containing protein n=1 Tax=Ornithinibacillus halophilus TaxID=930117 RepID=A0A1M5MYD5_9BACI|nr:AAA family ATPase [Ornithinibacillus halophilus]SHG82350.1 AAA domain-containing protein [Ornithinibacillus halophilus]